MKDNKKSWYDNASFLTNIIIALIFIIIIMSQTFAVKNNIGFINTFRSLFNHNTTYIIALIYFILLKTKKGKKYFNFINVIYIVILFMLIVAAFLTVLQSLGIVSITKLLLNIFIIIYMIYTFLNDTRLWKDLKLDKLPFSDIKNDWYFYSICTLSIIVLLTSLIEVIDVDSISITILDFIYTCLFARYIYLYRRYKDKKESNSMFDKIEETKIGLPTFTKKIKEIKEYNYNFYQKVAIFIMIVFFFIGIILGNVFPACQTTGLYTNICITEYNIALTIIVWFISFIFSMFIFAIGHIVNILTDINKKMKK